MMEVNENFCTVSKFIFRNHTTPSNDTEGIRWDEKEPSAVGSISSTLTSELIQEWLYTNFLHILKVE